MKICKLVELGYKVNLFHTISCFRVCYFLRTSCNAAVARPAFFVFFTRQNGKSGIPMFGQDNVRAFRISQPNTRHTIIRQIPSPWGRIAYAPQMSQNHNRLSFPIHPNNRIGHGKNYVRCRKNYIRHNSNYIRPFFTHSQHSEKQTLANKSPSRKILLKPNGLHLFSCFGQKLFNPRESPLRRRSQNPDHRKRKGR